VLLYSFNVSLTIGDTISHTCSFSSMSGIKWKNCSLLVSLTALRAAVPLTPPAVCMSLSSRLGYLSKVLVLEAISAKSSGLFSRAPITQSTSS